MTNKETAEYLRDWCKKPRESVFSWPTDGCGYDQHIRFVAHRNEHWKGEGDWTAFVLAYADRLDAEAAGDVLGFAY